MQTVGRSRDTAEGERLDRSPATPMAGTRPVQPVVIWAVIGALFSVLTLYILAKWMVGPNFMRVPVGPDQPPGWMKSVLITGQIVVPAIGVFNFYWFLVRPWRRQRRLTFDGIVWMAMLLGSVWDPTSAYLQTWFSYNSYLLNWGSPIMELPGVLSFHAPGAQLAWSFPFVTGLYIGILPWFAVLACEAMRAAQRRWPRLTGLKLIAVTYGAALLFDLVMEGIVFMPLGFWSYGGGWWPVTGGGHYYQLPLNNMVHASLFFAAMPAVRYFTNDKGETLAERGISRIGGSPSKQGALRILAVIGLMQVLFFSLYHIPNSFWGSANSKEWPDDIKNRSYFMNHCGPHLDRACPGPGVPLGRPGSGYLDWDGNFVEGN